MDFRCPSCQKDLAVPDEYAGQLMKCPMCQNTFQAPALPPAVPLASPPPPAAETYGVVAEPPRRAPEPPPSEAVTSAPRREPPPRAPEPPPVGDYARTATFSLNPQVVGWVAPAALVVLFFLTFFSWVGAITAVGEKPTVASRNAWGLMYPEGNALMGFYLLLFFVGLVLAAAFAALRLAPNAVRLPSALQQLWPWRSAAVALLLFLSFFFLVLQLVTGFKATSTDMGSGAAYLVTTFWAELALVCHLVALVASLLEFWLEVRGPGRPMPRVDVRW